MNHSTPAAHNPPTSDSCSYAQQIKMTKNTTEKNEPEWLQDFKPIS